MGFRSLFRAVIGWMQAKNQSYYFWQENTPSPIVKEQYA